MTVWGVEAVERCDGVLRLSRGDVLTPLARDRAAELGVTVDVGDPTATGRARSAPPPQRARPSSAPPQPPPLTPALYRRGAPGAGSRQPAAVRQPAGRSRRGGRVVVVGAGNVGTTTAAELARCDLFDEIALVDVVEGLAAGVALDLWHSAGLQRFATTVRGCDGLAAAGPAQWVVLTAGQPRQPGQTRADLLERNAAIVGDVAAQVARTSPDAVLLVVTNPLDEMTMHAWRVTGFPAHRVLGMAGVLDTARFCALAALEPGVGRPDEVHAVALGSHGEEMVIPLSQATVRGRPLQEVVPADRLAALVERTRGSGAEIVGLLRRGSAYLAPGAAAARMVRAMATDSGEVLPCSVHGDGSYGVKDVFVGLPAELGAGGVRRIVELPLQPEELASLRDAADRIAERARALTGP